MRCDFEQHILQSPFPYVRLNLVDSFDEELIVWYYPPSVSLFEEVPVFPILCGVKHSSDPTVVMLLNWLLQTLESRLCIKDTAPSFHLLLRQSKSKYEISYSLEHKKNE